MTRSTKQVPIGTQEVTVGAYQNVQYNGGDDIVLDGVFTLADLQALVAAMQANQPPP